MKAKRLISILLVLVIVGSFASCRKNPKSDGGSDYDSDYSSDCMRARARARAMTEQTHQTPRAAVMEEPLRVRTAEQTPAQRTLRGIHI